MLGLAKYLADITNAQAATLTPKMSIAPKVSELGKKVKAHLDKNRDHFGCKQAVVKQMLEILLDLPKGFLNPPVEPKMDIGTVLFQERTPVVYLGDGQFFVGGKGKVKLDRKTLTYRTITTADLTPYAAYAEALKTAMPVTFI